MMMKNKNLKLVPTRKYNASPSLTHEFKRKLTRDIKWLYVNKEFIEFIQATLKKLPQKDKLSCLHYFKKLTVQAYRAPHPDHYHAHEELYQEEMATIVDEQRFYNPSKWIDAEIEEMLSIAKIAISTNDLLGDAKTDTTPSFDPELVPEKKVIEMLGMSKSKLLKLRAEGLPNQRIGKPIFYNLNDVKIWLKENPDKLRA
jgi:hypothetical protein